MSTKCKLSLVIIAILAIVSIIYFSNASSSQEDESVQVPHADPDTQIAKQNIINSQFKITVTDGLTEKPLAASLTLKQNDKIKQTAQCKEDGSYLFEIPEGQYKLQASLDGYVAAGRNDVSHELEFTDEPNHAEIKLWPESKLTGRIIGDDHGVAAKLDFIYQKDASGAKDYLFNSITTTEDGTFEFDKAYAGKMKIAITADQYPEQTLADLRLKPGETLDLGDIPLKLGTSVYGLVSSTADQTYIANAQISLYHGDEIIATTRTKEDGSYRLPPIENTDGAELVITASGYHEHHKSLSSTTKVNFEYNAALSLMQGISVNISNITGREPIQSHLSVTDVTTEKIIYEHDFENGSYLLDQFVDGPYLMTLTSPDGLTQTAARAKGGDTVNLTLKPFARINVQCIIKKSGNATTGTYRYHYTSEDGETTTTSEWIGFAGESFFIENLKPGTYTIDARSNYLKHDKDHISHTHPIKLAMGDTVFTKIALTTGGTIRGKLNLPPEYAGLPGGIMVLTRYQNDSDDETGAKESISGYSGNYDSNGDFVIDTLPSGEFNIIVFARGPKDNSFKVSSFPGLKVGDNEDIAMDLDARFMRSETEDGTSLFIPRMPENIDDLPEKEKEAAKIAFFNKITKWQEALDEQAKYQKDMADAANTAPSDDFYDD